MSLQNSQHDIIMRSYEQKQLHNQDILLQHYKEVYETIPTFKELEDSISFLSVRQARKLLNGDDHALHALREDIRSLHEKKAALLIEHGYPADYLEPVYECNLCHDTGYIGNEKCSCFKKATIELLYKQSNLLEILNRENFNTFSLNYYSDNFVDKKTGKTSLTTMRELLALCHHFADNFGDEFNNLFLYGDPGVGKTFLSHCIAKELIDKAFSVIYFSAFDLFDIFESSKFQKENDAILINSYIFNCDLLIIDDLGTELTNAFTASQLFLCLNERLVNRRATIISTNLDPVALSERYSQRVFSRITSNYKIRKLIGDDIRIKKKLMNREGI